MIAQSKQFCQDQLEVNISATRAAMGRLAADRVSAEINQLLQTQEYINMIFAAAPSQNEFLEALTAKAIDWKRINAFHMDEYIGLSPEAPQGFGNFLRQRLFNKVPFNSVAYLNGNAEDQEAECIRYSELLKQFPAHICCLGIGENTHLAFNDPHVAKFNDPRLVKVVDLDQACRRQQVNDGCFITLDEVPQNAFTLTIPALFGAASLYCMVPGKNKARAIFHTITSPVTEQYPSTILRTHAHAALFTDEDSAALI